MRSSNSQPAGAASRMEVDPEVAALLDDIPATRLPEVLLREGWGMSTMEVMRKYGARIPVRPSDEPQPTYDANCAECGRPVTMRQGYWTDHSGGNRCDGLLVDEQLHGYHVTADEIRTNELIGNLNKSKPTALLNRIAKARGPCMATRSHPNCTHQCEHPIGHFGFHECSHCKHIWH